MKPRIGQVVYVRAGAHSVQERCAAIVTDVRSDTIVDLTVFPGNGVAPFAVTSVRKRDEDYREASNKEIFWHWPTDG